MTRPCNAAHPDLARVRCHRTPGHDNDHNNGTGITWPRNPRGATPAQRAAGAVLASAVLSDLATGLTQLEVARRHGISRQRVSQIGAGLPSKVVPAQVLAARVRELAAAAGEEPIDWIEDAARCVKACEEIVYILEGLPRNDGASPWTCEQLLKLAIGHNPPDLAAKVRAAVDAATEDA